MRGKRKQKEPVKPSNIWTCYTCDGYPMFEHEQFIAHLKDVHHISASKGSRKMTLHLDCADSYTSAYEWTIGGMKFGQCVVMPRLQCWQGVPS